MNDSQSPVPSPTESALRSDRGAFNYWRWFWLSFLVVSLAYAWYCFYVPSNTIAWADNYTSAQGQRISSDSLSTSSSSSLNRFFSAWARMSAC